MTISKPIYIDQNKSKFVILCAKCGFINYYHKLIDDELYVCGKCKMKINPN